MRNRAFTLLEVVLAIGLAGAVLALLATAIESYLVRVDASRSQVESAQLARALLNQIADDLRAARYYSPSNAPSSAGSDGSATATDTTQVQGIFGTETELRIDRSAIWQWDAVAQQTDLNTAEVSSSTEPVPGSMPQTVRYLVDEGEELLAAQMAATGVSEERLAAGYAGLYREHLPTAAWRELNAEAVVTLSTGDTEEADLIAPEVVEIAFAYFDGVDLLPEWDSGLAEGLPSAVEIRLTMLEEPFEQAASRRPNERDELRRLKENLVEYRLVVALPNVSEPQAAVFPQPAQPGGGSSSGSRDSDDSRGSDDSSGEESP